MQSEGPFGLFVDLYLVPGRTRAPQHLASELDPDGLRVAILSALASDDHSLQSLAIDMLIMYTRLTVPTVREMDFARHAYPAVVSKIASFPMKHAFWSNRAYNSSDRLQTYLYSIGNQPHAIARLFSSRYLKPIDPAVISEWPQYGADRLAGEKRLCTDVSHTDSGIAVLALWGLLALDASSNDARRAIQKASLHPDRDIRGTAVAVARQLHERSHLKMDPELAERAAEDPDLIVRSQGLLALWALDHLTEHGLRILTAKVESETNHAMRLLLAERLEQRIGKQRVESNHDAHTRARALIDSIKSIATDQAATDAQGP